ncbi:SDR family oxidoreductase [Roseobacter sp. YSTF-M11]|uniref:SDR family oxidoreductase n=1 Tax=Roseobacter insulae TaxID=2859783 RepID=A0A9X1FW42_9RHOB|nr:SDR family oxidoreductase [Roseobacter insulae]MBW4708407.1 SDR family oxidoreductase [Roseobacter insulae]
MAFSQDLAGRHAVVTGGASGLGRAISTRLAAAGAKVTIVDLEAARDQVPQDFGFFGCDLGMPEAKTRLGALADGPDAVDILVANAGVVPPWRGLQDVDGEEWQRVMAINTWGVAVSIGAFARVMAQSECASIVVMASINGFRAHAKQVLYTASKHAAIGITRAAALDLGPSRIRVNALAPGPIATEALLGRIKNRHEAGGPSPEEVVQAMAGETALGRTATPEEVANAAHFLASDASGGMTGAILPVEAGLV